MISGCMNKTTLLDLNIGLTFVRWPEGRLQMNANFVPCQLYKVICQFCAYGYIRAKNSSAVQLATCENDERDTFLLTFINRYLHSNV